MSKRLYSLWLITFLAVTGFSVFAVEEWNPEKIYSTPGYQVSYEGKVYKNRRLTRGNSPAGYSTNKWHVWRPVSEQPEPIPNVPPTIKIINPQNGHIFEQTILSPISIIIEGNDSDGTIASEKITVDGKTYNGTGVSFIPSKFGAFTITASVTDNDGATANDTIQIMVFENSESSLHVEKTIQRLFTPVENGDPSWNNLPTIAYCIDNLCIFWEDNNFHKKLDEEKMLKALKILQKYIDFGSRIMDYDPATHPFQKFTGSDGKTRKWITSMPDELPRGYGGGAHNGRSWNAISKDMFMVLYNTVDNDTPTVHQVFFYEMGRCMWDLELDRILDWQMEEKDKYGYWTLGFNGAMTVLAPENLGLKMDYYGQDASDFRANRLKDINTYINNPQWNFDNTWSVWLLPWTTESGSGQSINDMMSGLLIMMYDKFGGVHFLSNLFRELKKRPHTASRIDRRKRANNLYRASRAAYQQLGKNPEDIDFFFKETLRWHFLFSRYGNTVFLK